MHKDRECWVTVSQAARHFRVSRNTIYEACRAKELVCMRVRSLFRVKVNTEEEYLTVAEAAEILNISTSTVYEACAQGSIQGQVPHIRIRSRIRIPSSQLIGSNNLPSNHAKIHSINEAPVMPLGLVPYNQNNSMDVIDALL
jgi:excisionase family DNA binding protein